MEDSTTFSDADSSDDGRPPLDKGKKRMGIVGLFRSPEANKIDQEHAMPSPRWATQRRRPILKRAAIAFGAAVPILYVSTLDVYSKAAED